MKGEPELVRVTLLNTPCAKRVQSSPALSQGKMTFLTIRVRAANLEDLVLSSKHNVRENI